MDTYMYWYLFGMTNGIAWGALILAAVLYLMGKNRKG